MTKVTLGRTGITANKNGFGALPVQRVGFDQARTILRKAYDNGIDFFDTARSYSDSEEKIGYSLSDVRGRITIATKTPSTTAEGFWKDLETSLRLMKTDYVDILQFHNPAFCPKPGDGTGLYEAMEEARRQGKIRFIGLTNHRYHVAVEAIQSGLYDTIQFPFCYLATDREKALVQGCKEKNIGFIAMKALSGGLITNSAAAYAFEDQYDNVLPIWGVQREKELDEETFLEEAKKIKKLCGKYHVPFVINDNVKIALAVDADGVHVGQSDMEAGKVREKLGPDKIIGVSCKNVEQALLAKKHGADYLGVGAIYPTGTKKDADAVTPGMLAKICQAVDIPVVAIGGLNKEHLELLKGTGVDGIAVVSALFAADDIEKAAEELKEAVKKVL